MGTIAHRHSKPLLALCIVVMVGLGACIVAAQDATEDAAQPIAQEQRPINIDVRDMAVADVLRMLGQAANANIIVGAGVTGNIQSLTLRNISVEAALKLITEAQGYFWRCEDNVYVVSAAPMPSRTGASSQPPEGSQVESRYGQPPEDSSPTVPPPPVVQEPPYGAITPAPEAGSPEGQPRTAYLTLNYLNARDTALTFGGSVADYGTGLENRRVGPRAGTGLSAVAIRNRQGGGLLGSGMSTPQSWMTGMGQFEDEGAGVGGGLGGGLTNQGQGTTGTSGTTGAGEELLPDGIDSLTAFMRDNALLVRGTPSAIDEFREILAMLDRPAKQVEIATKWVEVTTTAARALGIDWSVSNGALEFWNLGFAPGEASNNGIRYGRGRFWAELAALVNNSEATVVNEPKVTCMNGMPGMIAFETEIPYFSATISYNQFGNREVDYTSDFVTVSNELFVVPIIHPDDSILMTLSPQLQDQVGTVEGPNGERIPIITSQFVSTTLRVHDGETFVLGGVMRKDESINLRRTPLLGDIPIIGKLFQAKRTERNNSELLIFVTPRIVRDMAAE